MIHPKDSTQVMQYLEVYFLNCLINIYGVSMQDCKKMQQFYAALASRLGFH